MKRIDAALLLLMMAVVTAGIVVVAYDTITTIDVKDIDMQLQVMDRIGINVDSDKIWFGGVMPGGSSARKVIAGNEHEFPMQIRIIMLGELKKYASVSASNFLLQPGESREISVVASTHKEMPYGNYTGIMRVVSKRAKP